MGYVVRKLNVKSRAWKIQYQTRVGGRMQTRDVKDDELRERGWRPDMSIDEARQIRDSHNASLELQRVAKKREVIAGRVHESRLKLRAHFSPTDLAEFETRDLFRHVKSGSVAWRKKQIHWDAGTAVIVELALPIEDWFQEAERFYDYFLQKEWSPSYSQKILDLINRWGRFVSRRRKLYFEPIPRPSGRNLDALSDAHYDRHKEKHTSRPLTPSLLEKAKRGLNNIAQYNWLFLTVWFGLRPLEVDSLKKPPGDRSWKLEPEYLQVYQTKLHGKGLSPEDRLKRIPIGLPEHKQGVLIIQSGQFERPLAKTIRKHCGAGITTYGGRKGFTDLMLSKGRSIEEIALWMGHRSIEMTWKRYKGRKTARWD